MRPRAVPAGRSVAAVATVVLGVLGLGGCGSGSERSDPLPVGQCPSPDGSGRGAVIDYTDFVVVDGVTLVRLEPQAVPADALGRALGAVRCTLSGTNDDIHFVPRDLDAGGLPAGAELRAITGYRTDFRVAAATADGWQIYQLLELPTAVVGEDLFDIRGKVTRIEVLVGPDGDDLVTAVDDSAAVERAVATVLDARVLPSPVNDNGETGRWLRFVLRDGTWVRALWSARQGVVARRIPVPGLAETLGVPAS